MSPLPVGTSPVTRASPAQAPIASTPAASQQTAATKRQDGFDTSSPRPAPVVTQPGVRPADGLKAYEELTPKQQSLLGEDGAEKWGSLNKKERAGFMVLTTRMDQLGFDTTGLQLKPQPEGIQQDRLLFEAEPKEAVERLKGQLQAAVKRGDFLEDKPSKGLHGDGMSDYGARQWVTKEAMQMGFGPAGLFVDVDRFGVKTDLVGFFGHLGEVLHNHTTHSKTDPLKVGKALHIDVASHLPKSVQ